MLPLCYLRMGAADPLAYRQVIIFGCMRMMVISSRYLHTAGLGSGVIDLRFKTITEDSSSGNWIFFRSINSRVPTTASLGR